MKLSIIVPAFNEESNIGPFYSALQEVIASELSGYDVETIFVDDGSKDGTLAEIRRLVAADGAVRGLSFSRNFGHQSALTAGMEHARGAAVVTMDCDLQDPPGLIPSMVKEWENGAKVVYARRVARQDQPFKKWTAALYYRLLARISDVEIPRQVGDFRLVDRVVVKNLMRLGEHARYLRGMVAWLGFKQAFVDFERPERIHGETHYPLHKMLRLALDGLLSFSQTPLKLALYVGSLSIVLSAGFFIYMVWDRLRGVPYPLFKWLIVIIFGFVGAQFILIWILGEYVGRIYGDVRRRPLFVIAEEVGADGSSPGA